MNSSTTTSASPSFLLLRRRTNNFSVFTSPSYLRPKHFKLLRLSASLSQLTWLAPHHNNNDEDYNGWAIVESPPLQAKAKKGLPVVVIGGVVCSSLALLLAAIAYISVSRKGVRLQFGSPLNALHVILNRNETESGERKTVESIETDASTVPASESVSDDTPETVATGSVDKLERVLISVAVDSTQQEALSVLKKLKIIEDDVKADELCTRREYARWLVRLNSLLERNPKHRIVPSKSLSGSVIAAFDDVDVEDPDFVSIQALAEAGVIPSKLLGKNCGSDGSKEQGGIYFLPERFLSRQDLINWKAQAEYEFKPDIMEQISRTRVGYMDVKEISSDAYLGLFMDMLAGDKSIAKRVFGQCKRFQPHKPSTKAQAAVALTSGRMTEAISTEVSRLEAERSLREAEMEEIRSELLDRGDIQRYWGEKFKEERSRGAEVEKLHIAARCDLEQELIDQEKSYAEDLKEKAALDCQRQLLLNLKEEVDEMSGRLASERAMYVAEKCELQDTLNDLQAKQEGLLDTKSILEAEKEALRILRSWVEDEARKSQARAKVLEEVGRRWRWDNNA
ncbi:S-layer domain containing protein [Melia azedarach]|uniref:S-layer domain containing protein n=1 Tax=Melia azedarach TaxID=155640 RepID=A0ACC1XID1_MELAZ|nr:S-layer domain containing protein [Melia azedarach]